MKRDRLVLLLSLVIAALLGFGVGWWFRDASDDSVEHRAHEAAQHVRDAFRALTR
jgi:hypothetical protein